MFGLSFPACAFFFKWRLVRARANSTLFARIGPQWLSVLRRLKSSLHRAENSPEWFLHGVLPACAKKHFHLRRKHSHLCRKHANPCRKCYHLGRKHFHLWAEKNNFGTVFAWEVSLMTYTGLTEKERERERERERESCL